MGAIDWEVIDFRYIISNINNMDFQPGTLPSSFSKLYDIDTKTTKGSSNDEHSEQPSRKRDRKTKGPKFQNESKLIEWRIRETGELINFSGHKFRKQTENA